MTTVATAQGGESTNGASYVSYVPHDLKYGADFEDSLIQAVLGSGGQSSGIRVIPDDSNEQAVEGQSVRASEMTLRTLPVISEDELPLPLSDARRVFASPLPGVRLTHPGGYLEGGPGLDSEMDTFQDDFISSRPSMTTSAQLKKALQKEIDSSVEALKERLLARRKARERNEQVEKELKTLMDQHDMELRIQNRMQEERARKKEAREKRRRDREGG